MSTKHELTHYGLTREELAAARAVHPSTLDARLTPVCGNGSYHALVSRIDSKVDCPICREMAFGDVVAFVDVARLDAFTRHYLGAALWSSTATDGYELDDYFSIDDIGQDFLRQAVADCADFQQQHAALLNEAYAFYITNGNAHHPDAGSPQACAGHDFWLTRNRHGAGFWDRGMRKELGDALTSAAQAAGSVHLDEYDMTDPTAGGSIGNDEEE